jgi:hypothetical protein
MSNVKRIIAREWLIFLGAIIVGFFGTYGTFYLGRNTTWSNAVGERYPHEQIVTKPKNVGDMFNDMWPLREQVWVGSRAPVWRQQLSDDIYRSRWNDEAVVLWLCVFGPYLGLCLVRSVIWSVRKVVAR